MQNIENKVGDMQTWKAEVKQDLERIKADVIEEARIAARTAPGTASTSTARPWTSISSIFTTTTTSTWRRRIAHTRGLAPYGSPIGEECIAIQRELAGLMGDDFKKTTEWLQPS